MAFYLQLATVKGESTAKGHEGWIELDSISLGVNRKVGKAAKDDTSGDIRCSKQPDSTSVTLARLCAEGKPAQPGTVDFADAQGKVYLQLQLKDVVITSHQFSGTGGGGLNGISESVTLNYSKMTMIKFSASADDADNLVQDLLSTPAP